MEKASVFMNNRTQAVRLPVSARFDEGVKSVAVRVVGQQRILTPVSETWTDYFQRPGLDDDFMPERDQGIQAEREAF
ncbi:antitoxin VapB [Deinococcus piscis]|uniref:Antitoxin VapB n=1 Tax=Deinococcus piscis TaxID=394230 RepID=A0ABQ3KB92_9DEIO|nr:type II toxin-antitoxin system VapB family antitoxin [Deinococcus piscis]GHG12158.1 antitoxin VapB [Deinococcus piscis]